MKFDPKKSYLAVSINSSGTCSVWFDQFWDADKQVWSFYDEREWITCSHDFNFFITFVTYKMGGNSFEILEIEP